MPDCACCRRLFLLRPGPLVWLGPALTSWPGGLLARPWPGWQLHDYFFLKNSAYRGHPNFFLGVKRTSLYEFWVSSGTPYLRFGCLGTPSEAKYTPQGVNFMPCSGDTHAISSCTTLNFQNKIDNFTISLG